MWSHKHDVMPNKCMQQSRNKQAGYACKFTHGLLMQNVLALHEGHD